MAVLSKIRERSLFLILIIGMALFAFVASPSDIMKFFQSDKAGLVGTINGEGVSQEDFTNVIKNIKANSPDMKDGDASKQAWDGFVREKIYVSQLEKAGIVVGEKDIWDAITSRFKSDPKFQNDLGMFDEEALKAYIDDLRENKDLDEASKYQWAYWVATENQTKRALEQNAYLDLITAGVGTSLLEGKHDFITNNTTVNAEYVLLPFSSIADSTVTVTDADIKSYIEKHKNEFQVEASRSIQYVKFDLVASEEDKAAIKEGLIADISALKSNKGEELESLVYDSSDIQEEEKFIEKSKLNTKVADTLYNLNIGDVFGPYEDNGYYKITKYVSEKKINSVKASHILVSYKDSLNSKPEITRTKAEAEARAKKLLAKVKNYSIEEFAEEAKVSSDGPSAPRGGALGTFKEGRMVPEFNDWIFSHKTGDIGMVETQFGFHVIMIEETFPAREFATIAKLIEPSQETESTIYETATKFENDIAKGGNFIELAKENKFTIKNAQKMTKNSDVIPGLVGNNSQIVNWTFEEDVKKGDVKKFDVTKAYVVAEITNVEEKGLQSISGAKAKAKPAILNNKKAALLKAKLDGTLKEIADREGVRIQKTRELSFSKPVTSTLGRDKIVVGTLLGMKEGEVVHGVQGSNGVYSLKLTSKVVPEELSTYEPYRKQLNAKLKKDETKIYQALKDISEIESFR